MKRLICFVPILVLAGCTAQQAAAIADAAATDLGNFATGYAQGANEYRAEHPYVAPAYVAPQYHSGTFYNSDGTFGSYYQGPLGTQIYNSDGTITTIY
jgi:hypothetical protein